MGILVRNLYQKNLHSQSQAGEHVKTREGMPGPRPLRILFLQAAWLKSPRRSRSRYSSSFRFRKFRISVWGLRFRFSVLYPSSWESQSEQFGVDAVGVVQDAQWAFMFQPESFEDAGAVEPEIHIGSSCSFSRVPGRCASVCLV